MRFPIRLPSILATSAIFATLSFGDITYVHNMVSTGGIQSLAAGHPSLQETLSFTLSNRHKVDVDSITDPTSKFLEGPDQLATISNLSRSGGSCGNRTVLNPAGQAGSTCSLEISFLMSETRDFHDPDSDYGKWSISSFIFAHKDDTNTIARDPAFKSGGEIFQGVAASLDKGVTNPLPEPASMFLIGSGMLGLGIFTRKRA